MVIGQKRKPKLSGAANRKIRRQKERGIAAASKPAKIGEYIERTKEPPNSREQWSHDKWRLEMRLVYLEMRKHKIPTSEGTSLIWAADVNARLAKMAEELEELRTINEKLSQIQGTPLLTSGINSQQLTGDSDDV